MKKFLIKDTSRGLYSKGYAASVQEWTDDIGKARLWNGIGPVKTHIKHCNELCARQNKVLNRSVPFPKPYTSDMCIATVEIKVEEISLQFIDMADKPKNQAEKIKACKACNGTGWDGLNNCYECDGWP